MNVTELVVFCAIFALVTGVGFSAAGWRRGDLAELQEWGLAGRRFGTWITWFLLGGDFYTAYTVIAVPALVYGSGAAGFFALPYTILVYPIVFLLMPRLWNVCKAHNFVTPADFIGGRHGNPSLTLVVALTGILATLPYIALQLVGMQVVLASMGLGGTGLRGDVPLVIAFVILAAYTYTSGLRAPAMIAFVKDLMIYVTVIVAVVAIPVSLGGFGHIFAAADAHFKAAAAAAAAGVAAGKPPTAVGAIMLGPKGYWSYATLALGSALAAFMYPHTITGVLSSSRADVIRRNAVLLPAYTFVLGLIALLGFMAIASDLPIARPNLAIPVLFHAKFPHWFVGFAFAAIAVGALVPAAVMSIAAANLWTRNVWKAYFKPHATDAEEARCAKLASLAVKVGALGFIIWVPTQFAINLQLLGGIWILQTLPAIVDGLYARRIHDRALLGGWLVGMLVGTATSFSQGVKPTFPLHLGPFTVNAYIGIDALLVNLLACAILTAIFDGRCVPRGVDATSPGDFLDAPEEPLRTTLLGSTRPV